MKIKIIVNRIDFPYGQLSRDNKLFIRNSVGETFNATRRDMNYYDLENGFSCHVYDALEVTDLHKPTPIMKESLDFFECSAYLQKKYGYDERDYAGKFKNPGDVHNNIPYQDFWQFVVHCTDVTNGSYIFMSDDWLAGMEEDDFRSIILKYYLKEFGEYADSNGCIEFWVEW